MAVTKLVLLSQMQEPPVAELLKVKPVLQLQLLLFKAVPASFLRIEQLKQLPLLSVIEIAGSQIHKFLLAFNILGEIQSQIADELLINHTNLKPLLQTQLRPSVETPILFVIKQLKHVESFIVINPDGHTHFPIFVELFQTNT